MIKNLKKEINLIATNENINEKLMICTLYNELYGYILLGDEHFIEHYETIMKKTFGILLKNIKETGAIITSAEQFMKIYLETLKRNKLSKKELGKNILEVFEKELHNIINALTYVKTIEQFEELSLSKQVNIMVSFGEYMKSVLYCITQIYDEVESRELRIEVSNMLILKLIGYLKENLEQGINFSKINKNLQVNMRDFIKNYLLLKLNTGELTIEGIDDITDENTKKFFNSFNELELKFWLLDSIYHIAGFYRDSKTKEEEICKILGISKEEYLRISAEMEIRSMTQENHEFYDDYYDDYYYDR